MLDIVCFILFLIYTVLIFCIKNYYLLIVAATINIILMIITKANIKKAIATILRLMPFVLFTTLINIAISGLSFGILIGLRLILVCNITYIYTRKMSYQKLQYTVETLLRPLKIFNIDSKEIGIILCIAISFIPIIQREFEEIRYSLKSKGFNVNLKNMLTKPNYILMPLITSIIKRVGKIEESLLSKGYIG